MLFNFALLFISIIIHINRKSPRGAGYERTWILILYNFIFYLLQEDEGVSQNGGITPLIFGTGGTTGGATIML